jgi:hypothetical protein
MSIALALTIVSALTLTPRSAFADAPRLETPPDVNDCPAAGELRQAIASQLGRDDLDRPDAPAIVIRVKRASDASLAADVAITTREGTSTRSIGGADTCSDLVRAAALSIALALDTEAQKKTEPKPPPPPEPPVTKERVESPAALARNDSAVVTASAITAIGLLPRPATGAAVNARIRVAGMTWLSARGFWLPEGTMPNNDFTMRLFAAGAGACVEPISSGGVAAVGCAHVVGGSFDVTKANVDMQSTGPEAYVAATLSAGARARIVGPLHVEGAVDAQLPFVRPTYLTTTCPPRGFEPPFMALALWLGAGMSFR